MSSRRKATSGSTIVTTTATESSHAPILRIATRPRPLARRATGRTRPAATVDGARIGVLLGTMGAEIPDRPYECSRARANVVAVDRGAGVLQHPRDHRQVSERHQRDRPLELGQKRVGRAGATPGCARQLRRASTRLPAGDVAPRIADVVSCAPSGPTRGRAPPDRRCRSGTWSSSSPWVSGSDRFANCRDKKASADVEGLRRSQPGERDEPEQSCHPDSAGEPDAGSDRAAAHPARKVAARTSSRAGLLDGTVGTGHHAHPRRLPLDPAFTPTRPFVDPGPTAAPRRHPQSVRLAEANRIVTERQRQAVIASAARRPDRCGGRVDRPPSDRPGAALPVQYFLQPLIALPGARRRRAGSRPRRATRGATMPTEPKPRRREPDRDDQALIRRGRIDPAASGAAQPVLRTGRRTGQRACCPAASVSAALTAGWLAVNRAHEYDRDQATKGDPLPVPASPAPAN